MVLLIFYISNYRIFSFDYMYLIYKLSIIFRIFILKELHIQKSYYKKTINTDSSNIIKLMINKQKLTN